MRKRKIKKERNISEVGMLSQACVRALVVFNQRENADSECCVMIIHAAFRAVLMALRYYFFNRGQKK